MMVTKKHRLMPDLEELEGKGRPAKSTVIKLEEAVMRLKESNLIDIQWQGRTSEQHGEGRSGRHGL